MTAGSDSDYKGLVLAATDIVELIGQSVALKRRGKDFVGLCPFHQEKTPSFKVDPARQYFYCFGCKSGGDAITFVMKRDRVDFLDALRSLGEKAGIEMPRFGVSKEKSSERQLLLEAHSATCAFFEKLLAQPISGKTAREYLAERGISEESVRRFQIGLAPDAWDGLLTSAVGKKFPPALLQQAGLLKARESGGFYDTFRNRLMFPIRDEASRIIAFGGRVMPGSEDPSTGSGQVPAKYLNSPETPLFSKSRCLFGLDLARQRIVETRTVAVVEGYTDVVMAHQYGVSNVVSALGTALTEQHVSILRRFADRIVLLFDADSAGDAAVNRAVELFLTQPVEIAIASMPAGMDPDEYLIENGAEGFEKLLASSADALSFKWKQLDREFAASGDLTARQRAVQQYLEVLAAARGAGPVDAIRWGSALARVSRLTEIPVGDLHRRFAAKPATGARRQEIAAKPPFGSEPQGRRQADRRLPVARESAERWLLGALLIEPQRWHSVQQEIAPHDFSDETRRKIAEVYWEHQRDEGEPVFNQFLGELADDALTEAIEITEEVEEFSNVERTIESALAYFREHRLRDGQGSIGSHEDEVSQLKMAQDKARTPDLRRVGS